SYCQSLLLLYLPLHPPPTPPLFPYTTLFRSDPRRVVLELVAALRVERTPLVDHQDAGVAPAAHAESLASPEHLRHVQEVDRGRRSEEHTSELQSRFDLVCRFLLEKKNRKRPD